MVASAAPPKSDAELARDEQIAINRAKLLELGIKESVDSLREGATCVFYSPHPPDAMLAPIKHRLFPASRTAPLPALHDRTRRRPSSPPRRPPQEEQEGLPPPRFRDSASFLSPHRHRRRRRRRVRRVRRVREGFPGRVARADAPEAPAEGPEGRRPRGPVTGILPRSDRRPRPHAARAPRPSHGPPTGKRLLQGLCDGPPRRRDGRAARAQ